MLVRAAVITASMFMAGAAFAAESTQGTSCGYSETQAGRVIHFDRCATIARGQSERGSHIVLAPLGFGQQFRDAEDGRGPDSHAKDLMQVAVSASIGNRDAVEIASSRLRKFGVRTDQIQDAIERTKLHEDPVGERSLGQSEIEVDTNSVWVVNY